MRRVWFRHEGHPQPMSNRTIRIGVIGLGAIGPSHIFAIRHVKGCELAAVCDVRPDAAAQAGAEHGVPWFTQVDDLLREVAMDAVTVCTPSGYHLDAALPAIAAGKHTLVEKPLEITTARADRIIAAARRQGVKLAGVFQSRFSPAVQRLKALVEAGLLGDLYSGSAYIKRYRTQQYYDSGKWRGTWAIDGGGCLMNQGIHCLDLLLWFMGEPEQVMAITETVGRKVEVETLATALVKFANGARGVVEGTTLAYPEFAPRIEIFGSRGSLSFTEERVVCMELMDPTPAEARGRDKLLAEAKAIQAREARARTKVAAGTACPSVDMGHTPIIADFADAIRNDREALVNGPEARRAVAFITAIYRSGKANGKPVRVQS